MSIVLQIRSEGAEHEVTLPSLSGGVTIGRGPECDIVLPEEDRAVSKRHCELVAAEGLSLIDHSRNGTFLNDSRLPLQPGVPARLARGDTVHVGASRITILADGRASTEQSWIAGAGGGAEPAADPRDLSLLEDAGDAPPFAPTEPPRRWAAPDLLFEAPSLFGEPRGPMPVPARAAFDDHAPPESAALMPRQAAPASLPPDWDFVVELGLPLSEPAALPGLEPAAPAPPPHPVAVPDTPSPLAIFFAAAGLPPPPADEAALNAVMEMAGRILARATAELHGLLAIRRTTLQEFGLARTMLGSTDNNPLKFTGAPEAALRQLLAPPAPGLRGGDAAIAEAFADVKAHQLSLLLGMRAALDSVCEALSPHRLAASHPAPPLARLLPPLRDAVLWRRYQDRFEAVLHQRDEQMATLLGEDFLRALRNGIREDSSDGE